MATMTIETLWERTCTWIGAAGMIVFLLAAFTPVARPLSRAMTTLPDTGVADAVVVLGASVDPDGRLGDESLRRAVAGVVLQNQGRAPLVLMLGPTHAGANEAASRARLARELGLPDAAILTESRGQTTAMEARLTAQRLLPRGARRILLVTGDAHLWRARKLFERAGFNVLAAPVHEAPVSSPAPQDRLATLYGLTKELAARALYRVLGRL
jgi:uncharacterized SAM-binding protein YcdF (DUF218 family)